MAANQVRWILHADMDAFYASVEQRDNPSFAGKPVIVGGSEKRGVVSTASYEARKYGVRSAMPIAEAKRRCPQGIYITPDIGKYAAVSNKIMRIFEDFSPIIEPLSLDEAFLDISGMEMLYPDITEIARRIKERVRRELALTVSVGIAANKFLAKLASDLQKPDGLVVIRPGEELALLAPLPVKRLWGVGEVTERLLKEHNIATIADFRQADLAVLERILGKGATELYNLAWGRDNRLVVPDREAKSIGCEDTFDYDISTRDKLETELLSLAERVGWRLRKAGLSGRTVTVKIRFSSFRTITRGITLNDPVSLDETIFKTAREIAAKISFNEGVRLVGIAVSNLNQGIHQFSLFGESNDKQVKMTEAVDLLRSRFGKVIVTRGRLLEQPDKRPR